MEHSSDENRSGSAYSLFVTSTFSICIFCKLMSLLRDCAGRLNTKSKAASTRCVDQIVASLHSNFGTSDVSVI